MYAAHSKDTRDLEASSPVTQMSGAAGCAPRAAQTQMSPRAAEALVRTPACPSDSQPTQNGQWQRWITLYCSAYKQLANHIVAKQGSRYKQQILLRYYQLYAESKYDEDI